jgi:hypothetical protein
MAGGGGGQLPAARAAGRVSLATLMGPGCCHDLGTTWLGSVRIFVGDPVIGFSFR